jgi:N-acetylglucosamine-6-phosphate deacetylase
MSEGESHALLADRVFDGTVVHERAAVVIAGSRIVAVVPQPELPRTVSKRNLPDEAWLAPGFIDLQVNGGGDVLFNDAPTSAAITAIGRAHRKFGTTGFLPTLISDTAEKMRAAVNAAQALADLEPSVLGIHLEGPFLSPEKSGVHNVQYLRPPTRSDRELLTASRKGAMLVTLAPERVPPGFIAELAAAGVRVALGHSMATYAETRAAMQQGLRGFTHLFNAMRPLESREPGPIAAALESPEASFGMIADGYHVDPATLRLALRGAAQPMLVTDAMPPVGGSRTTFTLYGEPITLRNGRCTRSDGTMAGAALDMASAVRNCVRMLSVSLDDALRLASTNPAQFIGLGHLIGRLAPGYRADLVALDPHTIEVLNTWVAGNDQTEVDHTTGAGHRT